MTKLEELKRNLKTGEVYRSEDIAKWTTSVDRHLKSLLEEGTLQKLSQGLYYVPQQSAFGTLPPDEVKLVRAFLKDRKFMITSLNAYNSLGVGTTQLYNERVVYNRKRHETVRLGERTFVFQKKPDFPRQATEEFLLVDLVNNLHQLAEDQKLVLENVKTKVGTMDKRRMKRNLTDYGNVRTKKILRPILELA